MLELGRRFDGRLCIYKVASELLHSSILPLEALERGIWFKLICGASYHHLPSVLTLSTVYTLAGADCIDVAADPAVVSAARAGVEAAVQLSTGVESPAVRPLLMVSLNDGDDLHFRKATFDPKACPEDCSRPCVGICPANAIVSSVADIDSSFQGVIDQRCYGCGRCLPVCPSQLISARPYILTVDAIVAELLGEIDAIEIHTKVGRLSSFKRLWRQLGPSLRHLKLLAISCPDGYGVIDYLWQLHDIVSTTSLPVVWQTDGRPMSGDIGAGTTHATIRYAQKVLLNGPPGYIQLAGGTNNYTVPRMKALDLLAGADQSVPQKRRIAGVAYGSYARALLAPFLGGLGDLNAKDSGFDKSSSLPACSSSEMSLESCCESKPILLAEALAVAGSLTGQLKQFVGLESVFPNKIQSLF